MKKVLSFLSLIFLSSCSFKAQDVRSFQFNKDVRIVVKIYDSGGALGETTYKSYYSIGGKEVIFFEGVNPRNFSISKNGDALVIKFCDGRVDLAQPIFTGNAEGNLIHIDLVMNCE